MSGKRNSDIFVNKKWVSQLVILQNVLRLSKCTTTVDLIMTFSSEFKVEFNISPLDTSTPPPLFHKARFLCFKLLQLSNKWKGETWDCFMITPTLQDAWTGHCSITWKMLCFVGNWCYKTQTGDTELGRRPLRRSGI